MKTAFTLLATACFLAAACVSQTNLTTQPTKETCANVGTARAAAEWVSHNGATIRISGNSTHQLVVKAGTVPEGQMYLYTVAEVPGPGNGCTMIAEKLSPGDITPAADAYTLRIYCKNPGGSPNEECDPTMHKQVQRIDPSPGTFPGTLDANKKFISANVSSLSTYALATGVRVD